MKKKQKCAYPGCDETQNGTWALVPLCKNHLTEIRAETAMHYRKSIRYHEREHYLKIAVRIPWSQVNMGVYD
ncbi:hypothetical protein [Paenibacillus elgii]|uniref:hypothetical protein n=1 Tax=Paenibacillus elgii TaxID=189691 RepID=UPI000248C5F9|nr:hypothetical protein [Paenibacillus elgii]